MAGVDTISEAEALEWMRTRIHSVRPMPPRSEGDIISVFPGALEPEYVAVLLDCGYISANEILGWATLTTKGADMAKLFLV